MDVARICPAVSVTSERVLGMGRVVVGMMSGAPGPPPMTVRIPHRLRNNNRLRQPIIVVPARLEFNNFLVVFILRFLSSVERANDQATGQIMNKYKTVIIFKGYGWIAYRPGDVCHLFRPGCIKIRPLDAGVTFSGIIRYGN